MKRTSDLVWFVWPVCGRIVKLLLYKLQELPKSYNGVTESIFAYILAFNFKFPSSLFFKTKPPDRDQKYILPILLQQHFQNSEANIWSCLVHIVTLPKNYKIYFINYRNFENLIMASFFYFCITIKSPR